MGKSKKISDWVWGIISFFIVFLLLFMIHFFCGSEIGKALSGSISVAGNIGAMIVIILTLREQQKENKRKDIIESFDRVLTHFNETLEKNAEFDDDTPPSTSIKVHLKEKWEEIRKLLDKITFPVITNETSKLINELIIICNNADLQKVSGWLLKLYDIKCNSSHSESSNMIKYYWDRMIPYEIKKWVGFYLCWNKEHDNDLFYKEIAEFFMTSNNAKIENIEVENIIRIPKNIPQIHIKTGETKISNDWENSILTIMNTSENISITKTELIFKTIPFQSNFKLRLSKGEHSLKLAELFQNTTRLKEKINTHLSNNVVLSKKGIPFNLYINYNELDWIYQGTIDFRIENNNKIVKFSSYEGDEGD